MNISAITANGRNFFRHMTCVCAVLCVVILSSQAAFARTLVIEGLSEPPLKWLSQDVPRGIDVDIMTEVLDEMDITDFTFHFVDSGRRLLHNAEHGFSDITLTLSLNDERSQYLLYPNEAYRFQK